MPSLTGEAQSCVEPRIAASRRLPTSGMCGRCESASGTIEGMTAPVAYLVEHDAPVTRTHGRAYPTAIPVGRAGGALDVEDDAPSCHFDGLRFGPAHLSPPG